MVGGVAAAAASALSSHAHTSRGSCARNAPRLGKGGRGPESEAAQRLLQLLLGPKSDAFPLRAQGVTGGRGRRGGEWAEQKGSIVTLHGERLWIRLPKLPDRRADGGK